MRHGCAVGGGLSDTTGERNGLASAWTALLFEIISSLPDLRPPFDGS
jgi:hypothetical protein